MPCMGPDLDWNRREAKKALAEIFDLLKDKYGIEEMEKHPFYAFWKDKHVEAKKKFEESLTELFVLQGCANF